MYACERCTINTIHTVNPAAAFRQTSHSLSVIPESIQSVRANTERRTTEGMLSNGDGYGSYAQQMFAVSAVYISLAPR